jgi:hypothetical protein
MLAGGPSSRERGIKTLLTLIMKVIVLSFRTDAKADLASSYEEIQLVTAPLQRTYFKF